ncbi:hypothetical protein J3R83DRAFT_1933 [Lanmaoa asiatica]|nr:hypothetical protein J3R83DRAFT_1933 [Lanmaoa asiatica]
MSGFTPSQAIDMSKEKDWPMHLGMLDWDHTKIVFTKRSLVEFLKYTGVTIDPGFTNIQKLPRYAQFGNMAASSGSEETTTEGITSPTLPIQSPAGGGVQRLLGEETPDDALSTAPPLPPTNNSDNATEVSISLVTALCRRVRTIPGGASSIASIFSDDTEGFVPTRRVRQRPGGEDNIEGQ